MTLITLLSTTAVYSAAVGGIRVDPAVNLGSASPTTVTNTLSKPLEQEPTNLDLSSHPSG